MCARNGVDHQIEGARRGLHLREIGGQHDLVSAEPFGIGNLSDRAGDHHHMRAHRPGDLDADVAQLAEAGDAHHLAGTGAQQWRGGVERRRVRNRENEGFVNGSGGRMTGMKDGVFAFPFDGQTIRIHVPDAGVDLIQSEIVQYRTFFEVQSLRYVRGQFDFAGKIVVDAGANIGNHSIFFSKVCGAGQCHAFEPNSAAIAILKRNIAENELENVVVHECGLSDREGFLRLESVDVSNLGGARFANSDAGTVPAVTLDSLELERVDFLKIDVEGMGPNVLRGAAATIARDHPAIMIEMFPDEVIATTLALKSLGYDRFHRLGDDNVLAM